MLQAIRSLACVSVSWIYAKNGKESKTIMALELVTRLMKIIFNYPKYHLTSSSLLCIFYFFFLLLWCLFVDEHHCTSLYLRLVLSHSFVHVYSFCRTPMFHTVHMAKMEKLKLISMRHCFEHYPQRVNGFIRRSRDKVFPQLLKYFIFVFVSGFFFISVFSFPEVCLCVRVCVRVAFASFLSWSSSSVA